jgi:cytochrome c553
MGERMRARSKCWLVVALSIAAAPAWADEAEIIAAVGKQLDAYRFCLKLQAHDLAKSDGTEDAIVAKAIMACHAEQKDLWVHLQMPPLKASPEAATEAVKQLNGAMWPGMINAIQAARGGS